MLSEVCKDVVVEPRQTPLTGEHFLHKTANTQNDARLDISVRGLWSTMDKTCFDVRAFHQGCTSNSAQPTNLTYKKHENEKKCCYNARVLNVEKSTFTPLVFSTHGGMGEEAKAYHQKLASLISQKRGQLYSDVVFFCILRSCLAAIRGFRGKQSFVDPSIDINIQPHPRRAGIFLVDLIYLIPLNYCVNNVAF